MDAPWYISLTQQGDVTRKWVWPHPKTSMPLPISLYFNVHISLRCTSLANMDLRVTTKGHCHKFSVSPALEDLETFQRKDNEEVGGWHASCVAVRVVMYCVCTCLHM